MTKEVKIGITGIVAIALLVYGINFLKGINMFKSGSGYYVKFDNIAGLVTSSPVYANGFGVSAFGAAGVMVRSNLSKYQAASLVALNQL